MMRRTILIRTALLWMAGGLAGWGAELPSAQSLLQRFVDVTGGQAAYDARKSEVAHGTVEFVAAGLKGTLTRYAAAPDLYRLRMDLPGVGAIEEGVKDGVAWEKSDLLGPRVKSGVERLEALREARLNSNAQWREMYKKVETTGEEMVNGEDCYRVTMTPAQGGAETMYLSKKTGLALKMTATPTTQMGDLSAEVEFAEYREFGGILTPAKVVEKTAGQSVTITIDHVDVNVAIPAATFDFPSDVAAMVAKSKP